MLKFSEWLEHKLSSTERDSLPSSDFAEPKKKKYPLEDKNHAKNALARVSEFGSAAEKNKIRAAVHKRYPGIQQEKD